MVIATVAACNNRSAVRIDCSALFTAGHIVELVVAKLALIGIELCKIFLGLFD